MRIFHCDLDNTLIYSYKRDLPAPNISVETYQGREISYMSQATHQQLPLIHQKTLFIPTTTRSLEQYQRIRFGFVPHYALVCNGGVLLIDGVRDDGWYQDSLARIAPSRAVLTQAQGLLEADEDVNFEVRFLENLFLFTKSANPNATIARLKARLDLDLVTVHENGTKVYVVPKGMDKGDAVRRFRTYIQGKTSQPITSLAAGDSDFDLPMLAAADVALVPADLTAQPGWIVCPAGTAFTQALFAHVLDYNCAPPDFVVQ